METSELSSDPDSTDPSRKDFLLPWTYDAILTEHMFHRFGKGRHKNFPIWRIGLKSDRTGSTLTRTISDKRAFALHVAGGLEEELVRIRQEMMDLMESLPTREGYSPIHNRN